ncbi:hypothetical protein ACNVED_12975 [Legionella sp. D16C41]|uniref:hypothetical protein n=1 Tax=Legionella sp. D16C41 TaxID=3402688 RepID=UPI003AF7AE8D
MATLIEDPKIKELIKKFTNMSQAELINDIFRHEKEVRGIDWLAYAAKGPDGMAEAKKKAHEYLTKLKSDLGVKDEDIDDFKLAMGDDVQVMPAWGINEKEAKEWKNASGEELEKMVTFRLRVMQSLELSSGDGIFAEISLSIGVFAWLKRAYNAYKVARMAGYTSLSSAIQGIRAVTLNATKAFVATVVVAIIAEIILWMMEKKAVVYTVLVNMTDHDLIMQGITTINGKQTVQFVDPLDEKQRNALNKRTIIDLPEGREANYWVGLFSASKRDMALIGSLGSYNFVACPPFPDSVYVGWEIPLSGLFGGPNRCLVSATPEQSTTDFAKKTSSKGTLYSTSKSASGAIVTAKMHSGDGSEGYMSVIFESK